MSAPDPKDLREIYSTELAEWDDIRAERAIDMRYVSGNPWKDSERKLREDAGRPVLSLDEIGQYHNQIINDWLANPRGMQFSPTGNGANDKGARFYENKARETEYRSQAQMAYAAAFGNMVEGSYGFVRLSTKYIHSEFFDADTPADLTLFNQDLWIEAIPNPDMYIPDSRAVRPDLRDQKKGFVIEAWATRDVERRFGKDIADRSGFFNSLRAPQWITKDTQQIAEYWDKAPTGKTRRLLHLKPGTAFNQTPGPTAAYQDQFARGTMPSSDDIVTHRDIEQVAVTQYLTNGFDILETKHWPGKYIPIAACFGKILYVPEGGVTKRKILSLTRLARDPYMLYCYYRTQQAEMAGMIPKAPVVGYKGQFKGLSESWARAPHEPLAFLEAHAKTPETGDALLPLPTRLAYEAGEHLQALELVAEGARRAIQAAMNVSPLPTDAQRLNEKSGKALEQIESSSQKGAFHFVKHGDMMIETIGVYFEDMCDKTLDTHRETGIRKPDGTSEVITINSGDPRDPDAISTKGDYLVTVTAGPTDVSERAAADQLVDSVIKNIGEFAQIAGPDAAKKVWGMSIRLKDLGAEADAIADVVDPPPPDGQKPPTPKELALTQENGQLKQTVQQMHQAIETKQIEFAAQKDIESMRLDKTAQLQIRLKEMDVAAKIETARISASKQAADPQAEAIEEHIALGTELAHTSMEAERDRQHEIQTAQLDHEHATAQAEQAASHGLVAAQQAADLAPPPTTGAST